MSSNLSELLDYLELYKVLLESKFYDPEKTEDAAALIDLIEKAKAKAEKDGRLTEDDCRTLKRKVSVMFHPDMFKQKLPKDLKMDGLQLIQKFNSAMDEVEKEAKNPPKKGPTSFKYSQAEPFSTPYQQRYEDYTKNDYFYSDQKFAKRPPSKEMERERRREERQEQFDTFVDGVKQRIVRTSEYVATIAKERFDAIFRAIPANERDYENIKRRFEAALSSLSSKENVLFSTLLILKMNRSDLDEQFRKDTTVQAINDYYANLINIKYNKVQTLGTIMGQADVYYKRILQKYAPEYNRLMREWSEESSEVFSDIVDAHQELHNKTLYEPDKREAKYIKKKISRLTKERDGYPPVERARMEAIEELKEMYPEYREAVEKYYSTKQAYEAACDEYNYVRQNEVKLKDDEFFRRQETYKKKKSSLDSRIESLENKHNKVVQTISDTRVRYGEFMDKYESVYDRNYSSDTVAHATR